LPRGSYPSCLAGLPLWWLGRRAKRGLPRACRQLTVIGEPCAGKPHARFDEGALVFGARGGS
jgi:hypothetical protein